MEQLTIFEVLENMKQPPRPDPADPLSLPGFTKVKAYLEGKGLPWEWIVKIPDTSDKYTIYLKHAGRFIKATARTTRGTGPTEFMTPSTAQPVTGRCRP